MTARTEQDRVGSPKMDRTAICASIARLKRRAADTLCLAANDEFHRIGQSTFYLEFAITRATGAKNFALEVAPVSAPGPSQVLVEVLMAALSPWQNQRLKDFKNYTIPFAIGELIDCDELGRVIESRDDAYSVGQHVTGRLGWQTHALANPAQLTVVDDEFSTKQWLTVLSSPGLTAYAAMDLFGRPMPGQTMVVTSAAGAVGSYAVQLGKLAGMHVVGVAGSSQKSATVTATLGADACIIYGEPEFSQRLHET